MLQQDLSELKMPEGQRSYECHSEVNNDEDIDLGSDSNEFHLVGC